MSLANAPVLFTNFTKIIPKNSKEFVNWTKSRGVICDLCKSKPFFTYVSWNRHKKGVRHNKLYNPSRNPENIELGDLKKELKTYKKLLCIYSNKISVYENKIKEYEKNRKLYVKELRKLKSDYIKLKKN